MKKFLVIDGNSILNRAFYGLSAARMVTSEGIHTNAIFGFLNIYYMIIEKFNPDYVSVAFDLKSHGYQEVTLDDNPDVIIFNTCAVTETSSAKSRKLIKRYKKK